MNLRQRMDAIERDAILALSQTETGRQLLADITDLPEAETEA